MRATAPKKIARRKRPQAAGGFTMIELLMTMLLLMVVLLGLAALQVGTIHRVTASRKANEATRLCQTLVEQYRFAGTLPADTGGAWVGVTNPVTLGPTWNADANGEGPFEVYQYVEEIDAAGSACVYPTPGCHKLITVKCSWLSQDRGDPATTGKYQSFYVAMSLRRIK